MRTVTSISLDTSLTPSLHRADYFEPYQPTHCQITEDLYREEGTVELQAVTEEARRASEDAPHPDQTPRLRSSSGE